MKRRASLLKQRTASLSRIAAKQFVRQKSNAVVNFPGTARQRPATTSPIAQGHHLTLGIPIPATNVMSQFLCPAFSQASWFEQVKDFSRPPSVWRISLHQTRRQVIPFLPLLCRNHFCNR